MTRKLSPTTCAPAGVSEGHDQECAASSFVIVAREAIDDARGDRRRAHATREVRVHADDAHADAPGASAGMHRGVTSRAAVADGKARGEAPARKRLLKK